jgi:hypothetical protein
VAVVAAAEAPVLARAPASAMAPGLVSAWVWALAAPVSGSASATALAPVSAAPASGQAALEPVPAR